MDGVKSVASATNAGWRGSKVKDGFQALVLEVDTGDTPEGRIRFWVEFESVMEVRSVEVRMKDVATVTVQSTFMETMGSERNVNG